MAAPPPSWQDAASGVSAGQLDVPLNKSQMLTVDQPVGRVMVGNAEVADVMPITTKSIYVLGKKIGTTSLTVFDKADHVMAVVDVAVGPDIVSLRRQIGELLPGEKIGASISNDAIVLTGVASSAPAIDRAVQLAKTYSGDKVVNMVSLGASQQVMLEVRFSEVQRDTAKKLGIGAFLNSQSGRFDGVFGNGAQLVPDKDTGVGVMQRTAVTDTFGVFRQLFNIGGVGIEGTLDALESKGLVKTLAQPTLIALSGETASFLAGGEFPIPVVQNGNSSGGAAQVTVEFKPFGVSLAFTPTVLADKVISLAVEPEVSAIDQSSSVQINGLSIPGLRTRRASTVLELHDGEAFAIAGLMQKDFGTTVRQLPILGSLPILGTLFRSTGFQRGETELVIVVIPHLVKPVKPAQISLPTDRVKDAREGDLFLMGRTDGAVPVLPAPEGATAPASDSKKAKEKRDGYEY
ncbi:type II and III secretion system protein family protein [Sphingobium nicotianae]|nr:type II and III secretion system protein family protein [Sphingobium nicotianae]